MSSCPGEPPSPSVVLSPWGCASQPGILVTHLCLTRRYMKHKRDDGPEKQEDEAVDVTPVMTCVFVVMCCSMLVLLYYFYDHLGACAAAAALLEKCSRWRVEGAGLGLACPFLSLGASLCLAVWVHGAPAALSSPHCPLPTVYVIIGIFCLASSTGLYSCLSPLVQRLPFGKCR